MDPDKLHIVAVTALIKDESGEKFLIVKRSEDEVAHAGLWAFPGGKLEAGEGVMDCLRREVKEEVGLEIADTKKFIRDFAFKRGEEQWVVGLSFEVSATTKDITLDDDFNDYAWITPEEFSEYKHIEALDKEVEIAFAD